MTAAEAEINGIVMHYRVCGEGEPLLLIMGLSANADWWDGRFLELLAARFQVVTFDNRGAGRTTKAPGPYAIPLMVEDTLGLMDHLEWPSAHVLGVSMGGMIAQELALEHAERVRKLVLVVTSCGGQEQVPAGPEVLNALIMPREGLTDEDIARATLYLLYPQEFMREHPEVVDETLKALLIAPISPHCFLSQLNAVGAWSDYTRLGSLGRPALVITGSEDILIPPENSRIIADAIPDGRLVEYEGGGHGLTSQFPEEVAKEVLDFLA